MRWLNNCQSVCDQVNLPPLPGVKASPGKLTDDETTMILRATLYSQHRDDPNVLRFIQSYMRCRDASQAAREAGLPPTAGNNLRKKQDIHEAITKLTEKSVMKYGYDATETVERVKEIAGMDLIEFENPDGSYKKSLSQISPEARRAIKKIKVRNMFDVDSNGIHTVVGEIIEIEVWDKMKAIELLGREKELFKETRKVEHDVTANMKDVLLDSSRRADQRVIDVTPVAPPKLTGSFKDGDT